MFMPHYAYLKMKMPGPKGIITISVDLQNAYQCDLLVVENAVQNLDSAQRELDYVLMQGHGSRASMPLLHLDFQSPSPKERRLPHA
jgi:hypothetical protein